MAEAIKHEEVAVEKSTLLTHQEFHIYCENLGLDDNPTWEQIKETGDRYWLTCHGDKVKVLEGEEGQAESIKASLLTTMAKPLASYQRIKEHRTTVMSLSLEDFGAFVTQRLEKNVENNIRYTSYLLSDILLFATPEQIADQLQRNPDFRKAIWQCPELVKKLQTSAVYNWMKNDRSCFDSPGFLEHFEFFQTLIRNHIKSDIDEDTQFANRELNCSHNSVSRILFGLVDAKGMGFIFDLAAQLHRALALGNTALTLQTLKLLARRFMSRLSNKHLLVYEDAANKLMTWHSAGLDANDKLIKKYMNFFAKATLSFLPRLENADCLDVLKALHVCVQVSGMALSEEQSALLAEFYFQHAKTTSSMPLYCMALSYADKLPENFDTYLKEQIPQMYKGYVVLLELAEIIARRFNDEARATQLLLTAKDLLTTEMSRNKSADKPRIISLSFLDQNENAIRITPSQRYLFEINCKLYKVAAPTLSHEDQMLHHIHSWSEIRSEMLALMNRYMVINEECCQLLDSTRTEIFKIDIQADLSDLKKIHKLMEAFVSLISGIVDKGGEGVRAALSLRRDLKPLVEEFYRFIERTFFMISHQNVFFHKVSFVEKAATLGDLKKFCQLKCDAHKEVVLLRFMAQDAMYSKPFFQPDWNLDIYKSLDRLRKLSYSFYEKSTKFFPDINMAKYCQLITALLERIQFKSPEIIFDALQKAKTNPSYANIPGFVQAVDDVERKIQEVGLISYEVKLIESASSEPRSSQPNSNN